MRGARLAGVGDRRGELVGGAAAGGGTPDPARRSRSTDDQPNPDQPNPDQANPDQANPDQANPDQANPDPTVTTVSRSDRGLAQVLVEFARTLVTNFSIQEILDHLVLRTVDLLPVTGAGVMLMGESEKLHFIAASNEIVTRIEGLQNELREGPCLEAFRTGQAVAVNDLDTDARFGRFSPRAAAAGLAAVFTFPMRHGDSRLGAVDLYRDTPGPLSAEDLQTAQILADVAAAYLVNAQGHLDASAALAQVSHRSLHDPLTGLANRTLLEELLDQAVARARRSHQNAAVLFADLDGFKEVNDHYGHHVGDQLLRAAATRLTGLLRPGDTLARLGGDEFVVLCEDLRDIGDAETVAARITAALREPFDEVAGHGIAITASVGIAFSGPGEQLPQTLLRDADFAMYQAKTGGGGRHHVLDADARSDVERRVQLERDLRDAQRLDQLFLAYQPVVEVRTRSLVGVEASVHWRHPRRGLIGPDVVIASAERTGLIADLGEWVLRQTCKDHQFWRELGGVVPTVAVQLSGHQVGPRFPETVARILDETGTDAAAVCLEVSESPLLAEGDGPLDALRQLRELGVGLSLDDFGTGHSSLSYLRQFPFTGVKIDRTFTADLPSDPITRSVVAAMIDLSHTLHLNVVAGGVETARELIEVASLGADHAQGAHLGGPLIASQVARYASAVGDR